MLFLLFESNGHLKPMWPRCFQVDKIIEAARKSSEVGFVTCAPGFWENLPWSSVRTGADLTWNHGTKSGSSVSSTGNSKDTDVLTYRFGIFLWLREKGDFFFLAYAKPMQLHTMELLCKSTELTRDSDLKRKFLDSFALGLFAASTTLRKPRVGWGTQLVSKMKSRFQIASGAAQLGVNF